MKRFTFVLAGVLLIAAVPALAHHSFTSFWQMDKTLELTGVVKSVKLVNPHPLMTLEVTEPDGKLSLWNVTATATGSSILKAGWTDSTLPVGTKIKIEGHPSRKEGAKAMAAGTITMPDGKKFSFGGSLGIPQG